MQRILLLLIIYIQGIEVYAQHQLGLRLETHAGLNSLQFNPSLILNNKSKWEIHLGGVGLFLNNNYSYIKSAGLVRLYKQRADIELLYDEASDRSNEFVVDFNRGNKKRSVNASAYIAGPGISYKLNDRNVLSIFSTLRGELGSNNIPGQYSYYIITNQSFNKPFPVKGYQMAAGSWMDIGVGYAHKLPFFKSTLDVGVNLKYILGYDMIYLQSKSIYNHAVIDSNDFSMERPNFSFGYSNTEPFKSSALGRGVSMDFGVNYVLIPSKEGYKLKIGAAIMDLGMIRFKNINRLDLKSDNKYNVRASYFNTLNSASTLDDVVDLFVQNVIGGSGGLTKSNTKGIIAPTTINLHGDYAIDKNIYLNGTWVQSLQYFGVGPVKGSLIALTPRWEKQWYSISLPLSLYQWQKLRTGFAARVGYFTIGSDDLVSLFSHNKFTGTDLYTSLKIHFGEINKGRFRWGKKGKDLDECYPL